MRDVSVLVCNGPNLGRLGFRRPEIYGFTTLSELGDRLKEVADREGVALEMMQSESEATLIAAIDAARGRSGLIVNPASLTMNGWALREALEDFDLPWVEVHISNVWGREPFRSQSVTGQVAPAVVMGCGIEGYELALQWLARRLRSTGEVLS